VGHGDRVELACLAQVVGDQRSEGGGGVPAFLFEPSLDEVGAPGSVGWDVGHADDPVDALAVEHSLAGADGVPSEFNPHADALRGVIAVAGEVRMCASPGLTVVGVRVLVCVVLCMAPAGHAGGGPEPDRREGASASPRGLKARPPVCQRQGVCTAPGRPLSGVEVSREVARELERRRSAERVTLECATIGEVAGATRPENEALTLFVFRRRWLSALRNAGVASVGQLQALSERELLGIAGMGIKSVADLSAVLRERGATLRPEDPVERLALKRPVSARDGELLRMRASGAGIAELSRRFEISPERVRQLLERDGCT